eukprot:TRINITY_DN7107_c0_g1_i9.p1 TRINITY_DN7107_c0_g1~~TRINITY_DN7107_c0_g1_i9.p1  ORF type:complete len:533 (+),score=50.60 TRINITY_DN7107_c0_g1_i9:141-1739(+)
MQYELRPNRPSRLKTWMAQHYVLYYYAYYLKVVLATTQALSEIQQGGMFLHVKSIVFHKQRLSQRNQTVGRQTCIQISCVASSVTTTPKKLHSIKQNALTGKQKKLKSTYVLKNQVGFDKDEIKQLQLVYKTVLAQTPSKLSEKIQVLEDMLKFKCKEDLKQALKGYFQILNTSTDAMRDSFDYWTLAHAVRRDFLRKNLRFLAISRTVVQQQVRTLQSLGFAQPLKLIKSNPRMISISSSSIVETFEIMEHNIGKIKTRKLIEKAPQILSTSKTRIQESIQNFSDAYDSKIEMWKIIEQQPGLLTHSSEKINSMNLFCERLGADLSYFVCKYPLFAKYSTVNLCEKFEYLTQEIFEGEEEIVSEIVRKNPRCLTGSKDNIQDRFDWFIQKGFSKIQTQDIFFTCSDLLIINTSSFDRTWNVLLSENILEHEIRYIISKYPNIMYKNLEGETQQQKIRFFNKFATGGCREVLIKVPSIFSASLKNRTALRYYLYKKTTEDNNNAPAHVQWSTLNSISEDRFCRTIFWSREEF